MKRGPTVAEEAAIKAAWEKAGPNALAALSNDGAEADPLVRQRSKELVVEGLDMKRRQLAGELACEGDDQNDLGPYAAGGHKVSAALEAAAALMQQHPLLARGQGSAGQGAGRLACVRKLGYDEAEQSAQSALKRLKSEEALRQLRDRHARELAEAEAKLRDQEMEDTMSAEEQLRVLQEEEEQGRREAARLEEQRLAEKREARLREEQRLAQEREARLREEQRHADEREATRLEEQRQAKEREEATFRELERITKEREARLQREQRLAEEREAKRLEEQRLWEEREARFREEQRLAKDREAYQQRRSGASSFQSMTSQSSGAGSSESLVGLKRKLSVLSQESAAGEPTIATPALTTNEQGRINKLASESMARASSNIITQGLARGASQDEMQLQLMKYYDEVVTELTQELLEEKAKASSTGAPQQKVPAPAATEDG